MSDLQVLTVVEAAEILRCTGSSVYRAIESGRLRCFRVGKRGVRITRAALEEFMQGEAA